MLLSHRTRELTVMSQQLMGLSALVKFLARAPGETLLLVMQLILQYMWYMPPHEQLNCMSPAVVGVRRKAASTLGYIFKHVREPALQYCGELQATAQRMYNERKATATEMAMLHEAMLGAVAVRGFPAMHEFTQGVLAESVQTLVGHERSLHDPGTFLREMGILQGYSQSATAIQARGGVYSALRHLWLMLRTHVEVYRDSQEGGRLSSYKCPWRPAETGFFPRFSAVLAPLMLLMRAVQFLWSPQGRSSIEAGLEAILLPGPLEGDSLAMEPGLEAVTDVAAVRRWLRELRELSCQCFGLAAAHGEVVYDTLGAPGALASTVLMEGEHLPEGHVTALLRAVALPVLRHCPTRHYPIVLPQVAAMLKTVFNRLQPRWVQLARRALPEDGPGSRASATIHQARGAAHPAPPKAALSAAESEEIASDTRLRDLTRELLTCVSGILGSPPGDAVAPDDCPAELGQHAILCQDVIGPIVMVAISALEWPDRTVERGAHRACRCLAALLASRHGALPPDTRAGLELLVGGEMLKAAIRSLVHQGPKMHGDFDAALLIRDVYMRLGRLCPHPRQVFLSLPGCTEAKVHEFETRVIATKEKQQRALFRDFIDELELSDEVRRRRLKSVPTLPEELVVFSEVMKRTQQTWEAQANAVSQGQGLAALFWGSDSGDI